MDFNFSDLQRMMLDGAERFLADHYTLEHRRSLRAVTDGLDAAGWAQFAEFGWLAILIPENFGGLGGSMTDAAILASALGSRCVTEPFVSSAVIGVTLLSHQGVARAQDLEGIAAGTTRIALADGNPTEQPVGTGTRNIILSTHADGFALSGQTMMVLDAPSATHFLVSTEGPDGSTLVLLPADTKGISQDTYLLYDGSRASDVHFDGVIAPADAIIASGKDADDLLALALDRARIILAAQAVGSMEMVMDICSAYLKERQQFGQPIGNFQSLQHIMANMFVAAHQARSMLYFALAQLDAPAADREAAVALARLQISEAAQLVTRQGIQLHGGYGVTDEYEVSHHYRRQMTLEKLYGNITDNLKTAAV
jgi:alkylation response protein AidB-like acyl-CoA dehydrogenase